MSLIYLIMATTAAAQKQNTTLEFKQMDYDPHPNNSWIAQEVHEPGNNP